MEITNVQTSIYKNLRDYLTENSQYKPYVSTRIVENKNPLVVFEETRNEILERTTDYNNRTRIINYTINIFADDKNEATSPTICRELAELVSNVMEDYYHATGGVIGNLPRYNDTSNTYQIQMRYTLKYIPSKAKLY
jgi:hypothetical protein